MALVRTTLSSACAPGDTSIVVASATGFAAGYRIVINQEVMRVDTSYSSGTTIPVIRAVDGSVLPTVNHQATTGVVCGAGSDWPNPGPQADTLTRIAGRVRTLTSYSAGGAIALPAAGTDAVAIINGTSICAMTVADPGTALDGSLLWIASNGAAAHTITFASGLSGAGSSYDVLTVNATAPVLMGPFMAVNGYWQAAVGVPMSGTVTNVTAAIA